jgi:hypothetical protein
MIACSLCGKDMTIRAGAVFRCGELLCPWGRIAASGDVWQIGDVATQRSLTTMTDPRTSETKDDRRDYSAPKAEKVDKGDTFIPGVTASTDAAKAAKQAQEQGEKSKETAAKPVKRPVAGDKVIVLAGGVSREGTVESVSNDDVNKSVIVDASVPGPTEVIKGLGYLNPGDKTGWTWPTSG